MTFIPQGTHAAFKANNAKTFAKKDSAQDRIIKVVAYDTKANKIYGEDERGETVSIVVSRAAQERCKKSESMTGIKWLGHLIDDRMQKFIPVGDRMVVESAIFAKKDRYGDKSINMYEVNKVFSCSDQDPEKVRRGLFTISERDGRVAAVQDWKPSSSASPDGLVVLIAEGEAENCNGNRTVPYGFMLRALVDDKAENRWKCVNSTPATDWVYAEKDENGEVVKEGHNITGEFLCDTVQAYADWLNESGIAFDTVDVMEYRSFKSSVMSTGMDMTNAFGLKRLAERTVKLSADSDPVAGKAWAVQGIIQLTFDEMDKRTKTVKVRNLATKLHTNGAMGDVRNWVRGPDGRKVQVADELIVKFAKAEEPAKPTVVQLVQNIVEENKRPDHIDENGEVHDPLDEAFDLDIDPFA